MSKVNMGTKVTRSDTTSYEFNYFFPKNVDPNISKKYSVRVSLSDSKFYGWYL
ncbi:hypothetical protein GCM10010917_27670 [Paenibacillus physcomitrellae]|uniref:Uncharacterized protein n=1 Tax=Paenibacillus physcomitrellae TaxID=1619311 RepID=A0ABQ1GC61_9BACL|nr:hypothetical protein GCM10010917_27670 [Paenibacillus physcomitrellae]